jgi:hypothetical protein
MIRQNSHGNLFIPVEVTKSFLGLDKGTILKFDSGSGKYINVEGEEEIGDGEYYYSGHAIAIDPYLVQDNEPEYFRPWFKLDDGNNDKVTETTSEAETVESSVPEEEAPKEEVLQSDKSTSYKEEFTLAPGSPVPEEVKEAQVPVDYKPDEGILMFSCGLCQHENFIHKIKHGLFFPVSDKTKLVLNCENCGIETTVFYEIEGNGSDKENE